MKSISNNFSKVIRTILSSKARLNRRVFYFALGPVQVFLLRERAGEREWRLQLSQQLVAAVGGVVIRCGH